MIRLPRRRTGRMVREQHVTIELDGRTVPVRIRHHPRARRLILRIDPQRDGLVVTLPPQAPADEGLELARRKGKWIVGRLDALPPRIAFADGASVPFLGTDHVVRHRPLGRRPVWRENGEINVSGGSEHLPRRLRDWLENQARHEIGCRVAEKARRLGRAFGRVGLRDTRSRWGSCSAAGNFSFCWRLIMMPAHVLDYVVAHEVAHLEAMDHGAGFWRTVGELTIDSTEARAWLHRHGARLRRYG